MRKLLPIKEWKPGIPDGLTLKCPYCGKIPKIDYHVPDPLWKAIAPKKDKLGVICLSCFVSLAKEKHILFEWIIPEITRIFYTTKDYTIELTFKTIYSLDILKENLRKQKEEVKMNYKKLEEKIKKNKEIKIYWWDYLWPPLLGIKQAKLTAKEMVEDTLKFKRNNK